MRFLSPIRHPDVELVRDAWSQFVDREVSAADRVRPYVWRAWKRSREAGCDPRRGEAQTLSAAETAALIVERENLMRTVTPFLLALSRAAGTDRHAAMLADGSGRLLAVAGDAETMNDEAFPRPGALLSEATSGANGVGTALAENGYVELVGPEHFIEGFHQFTCQGVPLAGPSCVEGIVSMSVRRLETADRVRDILFCASEAAECELLAQWLTRSVDKTCPPVLERLRQDIVQKVTVARLRLELAAQRISTGNDASANIEAAKELSRTFARQAAVWKDLAVENRGQPEVQPVDVVDLVEKFVGLLQTEARVASVQWGWGRVAPLSVLADRRELSRQLLTCFLSAIQSARPGSILELNIGVDELQGQLAIDEKSGQMGQPARNTVSFPRDASAPADGLRPLGTRQA